MAKFQTTAIVASASIFLVAACDPNSVRDPRSNDNIFTAGGALLSGSYDRFLAQKKVEYEAAIKRQRQVEIDNQILLSGATKSDATRTALASEKSVAQSELNSLNRQASAARAATDEEKSKLAALESRRAELNRQADLILAGGSDTSALEAQLTSLRAEQQLLLDEYESLASP